jgi:predicted transcriptional regulator
MFMGKILYLRAAACFIRYIMYIQEMLNVSNGKLTNEQRGFIDDFSALLTQWNMPITAARVYCYLQLMAEPVSLEEMADELEVSKSNVCSAAKMLESHGNARRVTERGTRRILYAAADDPGAPLRKHVELLGRMAGMIRERTSSIATGAAKKRLKALADFDQDLEQAMASVIYRS